MTVAGSNVCSCGLQDAGRQMEWKSSPIKLCLSSEKEANGSERRPLAPWQKVLTQIFCLTEMPSDRTTLALFSLRDTTGVKSRGCTEETQSASTA